MDSIATKDEVPGLKERLDANLLLDFKQPIEAMDLYQQSILLSSGSADAHNELGLVYLLRYNNIYEAVNSYTQALKKEKNFYIYFAKATAHKQEGEYALALEEYFASIESSSDIFFTSKAYIESAKIMSLLGNYTTLEVLSMYEKAIDSAPEYYLPYYELSLYYFYAKEYDKARIYVNTALTYNSFFVLGYYMRSYIALYQGEWSVAYKDACSAKEYSEEHPKYVTWCTTVGEIVQYSMYSTSERRDVFVFLELLILVEVDTFIIKTLQYIETLEIEYSAGELSILLYAKGFLAFLRGEHQEAFSLYKEALLHTPCYIKVQERLIALAQDLGNIEEALVQSYTIYEEAEKVGNLELSSLYAYHIGAICIQLENSTEAVQWYWRALEESEKENIEYIYGYIYALYKSQDFTRTIENIKYLKEKDITSDIIFRGCVEMLYSMKAYRDTVLWCKKWILYNPSAYLAYFYSASANSSRQYFQEALESIDIAISLFPSNTVFKETREHISTIKAGRDNFFI